MTPRRIAGMLPFVLLAFLLSCNGSDENPGTSYGPFDATLLKIAQTYQTNYFPVNVKPHLSPVDCQLPPPSLHLSASADPETHGRKLYHLFVKQHENGSYMPEKKDSPVGQALVKEAWEPEEAEDEGDLFDYRVRMNGRSYRAGRKAGLFIMYKMEPTTPDTDNGWVYGTLAVDGTKVTSAGRVEACMKCHLKAPYDRLFGPPKE